MRELSLIDIQNAFAGTERQGADVDEPEGARYVQISETLALEIAWNLGRAHGEMIKLREEQPQVPEGAELEVNVICAKCGKDRSLWAGCDSKQCDVR